MRALIFLLETLVSLFLLAVLLRLLLQWLRADFRNPLCRALVQVTSPLLVPLRRMLPSVGRIDTASVLLVVTLALLKVAIAPLLSGRGLPEPLPWIMAAAIDLLITVLWVYLAAIIIYSLMSMIAPHQYSPATPLLATLCEPILRPLRRLIPPLGGIDLSPLWAVILINTLLVLLN
jgi:YggT family protein